MKISLSRSKLLTGLAAAVVCGTAGLGAADAESAASRTIRLRQNDAQIEFASKIYELRYVPADEILPFVNSAIKRYNVNSTIRRITADGGGCGALLVSTGVDFMPYVDSIVAALDREAGIEGTGIARVTYEPRYRGASGMIDVVNDTIVSSSGTAYLNEETNTIAWRDQSTAAERTLDLISRLDRPLPQARIRLNYYELRDSDLKDWGFDYLAWKNGPGVNLLNVGYNAGELFVNELLESAHYAIDPSWSYGGFFTAPQFDMSFIRCLQQSGNTNAVADATMVMVNTPVATPREYELLLEVQDKNPDTAPFIYRISMHPEYQNISKNVLGRTLVGKSYYEDDNGVKHPDPPALEARIINPFICFGEAETDETGFIPCTPEFYQSRTGGKNSGGVIFDYVLYVKNVIERGNTGAELSNSAVISGAATLGFGREKVLAVYEKSNDVEQTIGLPIFCRIPVIKYIFSTVTTIQERTYIIVTAEASPVHPDTGREGVADTSVSTGIDRRIENPVRPQSEE